MSEWTGQCLGRYRILEQLGEGGMAIVYKAFDPQLEREVAIKVIRRGAFLPGQMDLIRKRFDREARVLAGLTHPNIVKVLDFGEEAGTPYLVMEYIVGGSLKDRLSARAGRPIPWQEAARLLLPIARALGAAHQATIVHRDVKPANILIDRYGTPMLTDFGIAKVLETEETSQLTGSGVGIGTPDYMAPEQGAGREVDQRVDIYALGVMFFEMITGQKPYHADTPLAVLVMKSTEPLPRPSQMVPGLPVAIDHILFKALARDPNDRYADMGEMASVLERLAEGRLPQAEAPTLIQVPAPARRSSRLPWTVGIGGLVLLCLLAALGLGAARYLPLNNLPWKSAPASATSAQMDVLPLVLPTETETRAAPTGTAPSPAGTSPETRDQAELVFIPEGEFLMGSDIGEPYFWGAEQPKHTVYLDAFWIYRTEVTNLMYRACVEEGTCSRPAQLSSHTHESYFMNPQFENYPVIHVTHADARAYCEWAGARLPTEAEWEKAARGTEGSLFPWGNEELQSHFANFCDEGCPDKSPEWIEKGFNDGYRDVAPVGSYPAGASPYGVLDVAGNVLEWVSDWYGVSYYSQSPYENPTGPAGGTKHIIRGGSWGNLRDGLRPAARASKELDYSADTVGFRCALDAP